MFGFLLLSCVSSLYIFGLNLLSGLLFVNLFFYSVGYFFVFFNSFFNHAKAFQFEIVSYIYFYFYLLCLWGKIHELFFRNKGLWRLLGVNNQGHARETQKPVGLFRMYSLLKWHEFLWQSVDARGSCVCSNVFIFSRSALCRTDLYTWCM